MFEYKQIFSSSQFKLGFHTYPDQIIQFLDPYNDNRKATENCTFKLWNTSRFLTLSKHF